MTPHFAQKLIHWQQQHGRNDLPWQVSDPYRIWLSEIMLQQTQVATVLPYYQTFLERFPDVQTLAQAPLDDVLARWSGLGYYTRARNLHLAAQHIVAQHGGAFPNTAAQLAELPGIGRSTAAAIAAFAFGERAAILDGNVRRVLARHAGIAGYTGANTVQEQLWRIAEQRLPNAEHIASYTQGLMDLGSLVCSRSKPNCPACPVQEDCIALRDDLTRTLPTPKPKKEQVVRSTVMLLIEQGDAILLLQRPPSGIWGGLWCLPECDSTLNASQYCQSTLGLQVCSGEIQAEFSHTFTHFRLDITVLAVQASVGTGLADSQSRWFSRQAALQTGIPAPLRKVLSTLPGPLLR